MRLYPFAKAGVGECKVNPAWVERYGPWALVTGASSGIGRQMARAVAKRGLNVVLVARRAEELAAVAAECTTATRLIAADLSVAVEVERVARETAGLDVGLVVAAAGFGTSGAFVAGNLADELNMVDLNCRSVVALSHEFGRRLARRGRGGLILYSSLVAFQGVPRAANYAATKAFVQSLAEGLRVEWKPLGVDVLACAPGPVHGPFSERANLRMGAAMRPEDVPQDTLDALGRRTTVRPGFLSKFLAYSLSLLPRWGRVQVMTQVMGGMTKHQNGQEKNQARGSA